MVVSLVVVPFERDWYELPPPPDARELAAEDESVLDRHAPALRARHRKRMSRAVNDRMMRVIA